MVFGIISLRKPHYIICASLKIENIIWEVRFVNIIVSNLPAISFNTEVRMFCIWMK